jgi:hypothetical protein
MEEPEGYGPPDHDEMEQPEGNTPPETELMEPQEEKGYGEDEGEREESLPDE